MKNIKSIVEGILFGFAVFFIFNVAPWIIGGASEDREVRIFWMIGLLVGSLATVAYIMKSLKK